MTKDGKRFWKISVSRGHGKTPFTKRFYWPSKADGNPVAKNTAERELKKAVADFERACSAGEVLTRAETKEKAAQEAAEAAKLKSLKQYVNGVFMPSKEATIAENTRASYRMFLDKHILPPLGDVLLTEIRPAMLTKLILDFQKDHAHSTCVKLYVILNEIFEMAFLDDSIQISPMLKVKRPAPQKDKAVKEEGMRALTAEQLRYVLSCADKEPLIWRVFIYLAADTGARRGELCGLQWSDIDWKCGTICIKRNLQRTSAKGTFEAAPKNGKTRIVDIGAEMLALLRQLREEQAERCLSKWVFTFGKTSEPLCPLSPTQYCKRFSERYGLKKFHLHLLRHTSASIGITNGADPVSVSERLGHSDVSITLKIYSHANEESVRRAGQTVRDALKAQDDKTKEA